MTKEKLSEKAPHETLALSPKNADTLYAFASSFYDKGNYEQAIHCFRVLTAVEATSKRGWFGLAAALQMNYAYKEAIDAYSLAALFDPNCPYPHLYAGECLCALKEEERAKKALESAKKLANKEKGLLEKIEHQLSMLKEVNHVTSKS